MSQKFNCDICKKKIDIMSKDDSGISYDAMTDPQKVTSDLTKYKNRMHWKCLGRAEAMAVSIRHVLKGLPKKNTL